MLVLYANQSFLIIYCNENISREDPSTSQGGETEREKSSIDTPVLESPG